MKKLYLPPWFEIKLEQLLRQEYLKGYNDAKTKYCNKGEQCVEVNETATRTAEKEA